ncbi:hypothetical protein CEP52_012551 [Fusarium oligoseptatum]|uniref:Uncharacterized protein n=1 Tax=Fusarium oligoseptatum TaxID=2604345 RepID=A0A428SXR6_9HYPO|nr:hypothetical protein CEP52_012551 [Fusarium oligoseptatum]
MSLDASRGLKVPAKEVIGMRAQQQPATHFSTYQDLPTKHFTVTHNNKQYTMGLFWSKGIGGRHFGTSIHVDKNGVRRGPWRFSLGKFSCFRA